MDSLTHTVLGACTGELIAGKKLGKKAMLIGAVVNNLPDIDMFANFWHSQAEALLTHRGITHSIFFMLIMSPALAWLGYKFMAKHGLSFKGWMFLITHGFVLHLGLDACTAYGTGWFEPFSSQRVSFNTLFILDPLLMLPLLIAAITLLIMRAQNTKRAGLAGVALSLSGLYLLSSLVFKEIAHKAFVSSAQAQKISTDDHFETPTALNNLLWYAVINEDDHYKIGYYSVLDSKDSIEFKTVAGNHNLLLPYASNSDVRKLLQFSRGYYRIDSVSEEELLFSDVRFGQLMGCSSCDASFVFRYSISQKSNETLVKQAEFQKTGKENLKALYDRVLGKGH